MPKNNRYPQTHHGFPRHLCLQLRRRRHLHLHNNATHEFRTLYSLFEFPGLPINSKKVCPPSRSLTCMGIDINVDAGTMSIPLDKCIQILDMCKDIVNRKFISKKLLQSLLGKLIYLHRCVSPGQNICQQTSQYLTFRPQ